MNVKDKTRVLGRKENGIGNKIGGEHVIDEEKRGVEENS